MHETGQETSPAAPVGAADRPVIVVSGLPRSGTSMMMQMLDAGGHPVLADDERRADGDNPRGYLEYEPVKALRADASWLPRARGRAVKIIAQLLPALPPDLPYRVVFMERDLNEVLASQQKMLERQGQKGPQPDDAVLARLFKQSLAQVRQLLEQRRIPTLYVGHRETIENPPGVAARVNAFLGGDLDQKAMATAVDGGLYRQRQG